MKNTSELFPYLLARIAGGSMTDFKKMELKSTLRIVKDIEKANKKIEKIKEQISEQFYTLISTTTDSRIRNILIKVRRDVHNGRAIDYLSDDIKTNLPLAQKELLVSYIFLSTKIKDLHLQGEQMYNQEFQKSKEVFYKLVQQSNFRNGILLSSSSLTDSLDKYISEKKDPAKPFSKLERSLMEYLSRMHAKTSPFSTFTHVGIAEIEQDKNNSKLLSSHRKINVQSRVKLNHMLYGYFSGLLFSNKKIKKHLHFKLNFTIKREDKQFVFYTNNNNDESIQRIDITAGLEIIYNELRIKDKWIYHDFITEVLGKNVIDVSQEKLENYIDDLLSFGFLEYDLGVSGIDPEWDKKLAEKLSPLALQFPVLAELIKTLKSVKKFSLEYEKAKIKKRKLLLHKAYDLLRQTSINLQKDAGILGKKIKKIKFKDSLFRHSYDIEFKFKPHNIWYEDTFAENKFSIFLQIKEKLDLLGNLLNQMASLTNCRNERYELAYFFRNKYGEKAKVDLLNFYEDYLRELRISKKKNLFFKENPIIKERIKEQKKLLSKFIESLQNQLDNREQINITTQHIVHLPTPKLSRNLKDSFGAFFQIDQDKKGKILLVINNTLSGFGKMFSRFLYLFDSSVTNKLRSQNNKIANNVIYAEGTDASLFNINLHPQLSPYEIQIPGGNNSLSEEKRLFISNIAVSYDKSINRLLLFDKITKKEIFIFDIGFQNIESRSKFYSFISSFTFSNHYHDGLSSAINSKVKNKKMKNKITILPRIIYEESVVLQRKTWIIPTNSLPIRTEENDWDYFLKIDQWRKALNMPEEVFITKKNKNQEETSYNYKPQYICFSSPIFIGLLEKLIEKITQKLEIQEMLPENNLSTEFFIQYSANSLNQIGK